MIQWAHSVKRLFVRNRVSGFLTVPNDRLLDCTFRKLDEYFEGHRKEFDLPVTFIGTDFEKSIWNSLCKVPYGETRTYADIAATAANRKAVRAAASAIARNPVNIVVPCHRIVPSGKSPGNYAGGTVLKLSLLELEKGVAIKGKTL